MDDVFFAVLENGHKLKVKATERQREVLGSPESRQSETPVLIEVTPCDFSFGKIISLCEGGNNHEG
ncbi:MAG: hypothetical protein GX811_04805 [Lentisphaerae bacterium]|nr:hypothetical protein [Lentisphaerota bacterium]